MDYPAPDSAVHRAASGGTGGEDRGKRSTRPDPPKRDTYSGGVSSDVGATDKKAPAVGTSSSSSGGSGGVQGVAGKDGTNRKFKRVQHF